MERSDGRRANMGDPYRVRKRRQRNPAGRPTARAPPSHYGRADIAVASWAAGPEEIEDTRLEGRDPLREHTADNLRLLPQDTLLQANPSRLEPCTRPEEVHQLPVQRFHVGLLRRTL